jgi:uncharacterized protein (TIRG00374 family)
MLSCQKKEKRLADPSTTEVFQAMADETFTDLKTPSGRSKWALKGAWLMGFLLLGGLIAIALKMSELKHFANLARQAHPGLLVAALALQGLTYVAAAAAWHVTLVRSSHPISLARLVPLGLAKLFTDQALPSGGVSGNILVARGLTRRGIPANLVLAAILVSLIAYYAAYLPLVASALVILWFHHQVHKGFLVALAIFAVVAVAIPTIVIWIKRRGSRLPHFLNRFQPTGFLIRALNEVPASILHDPVIVLQATFYQAAVFFLDAGTLWVMLLAIGQDVSFGIAFTCFMAASVAATIGPIPLGLGTFEAVSVATFGMLGVQIEVALTATLLLRGFSFWLPMIPGVLLARQEIGKSKTPARGGEAAEKL